MKKCLSLWIYGSLGEIQCNIITWKRRLLYSLKFGRYYWCRLRTPKNNLQRFWNKTFTTISRFVCSNWYIVVLADVFGNFENLCAFKYMNLILQSFFQLLDQHENIFKKDKSKIKFLTDIHILLIVEKGLK